MLTLFQDKKPKMDDEIEILDELEVTKVIKNPIYKPWWMHKEHNSKPKNTYTYIPISQPQKCRFCTRSFNDEKKFLVHYAFIHYKNYLEEEMKRFFDVPWDCSVCFDELGGRNQALLHVAISHQLGMLLVIRNNF